MKAIAVLAVTLATVLLLSTVASTSYAYDNSVKVYAKEKQGMILLIVRNAKNVNIHELKMTLLDGAIDSAKREGWNVSKDAANQITVSSTNPIPPNGREVFLIKANNINSIISWTAKDRFGSVTAMDNARVVIKQTLDSLGASDATYIPNARSVTITTDKVLYKKGEKMLISGVLDPDSKITITIYTPSGQKVKIGEKTDLIGNFKALHVLHNAESGTYILKVSEAKASVETTFKVI